jgi:hypothetical protein
LARAVVRPARRLQPEPAAAKTSAGRSTDPPNLWTGVCQTAVAATLRHKDSFVNLTVAGARIKWVTRTSGFHVVRPVLKLADGTFVVGDSGDGAHSRNSQRFSIRARHRQRALAVARHRPRRDARRQVGAADLSKVDESGSPTCTRQRHGWGGFVNVSRIEVYGAPSKR